MRMILSCHKLRCLFFLSHSHKYMETYDFHENSPYKNQICYYFRDTLSSSMINETVKQRSLLNFTP